MNYKFERMEAARREQRLSLCSGKRECFEQGWRRAMEVASEEKYRFDILEAALAAAEAECAEWRELVGRNRPPGWTERASWEEVKSANANDATRARLGLGRIGEAR